MAVIYEQCGVALEVRVDFGCEDATPIVRCKQGDKRRALRVYPRENGNEIITRDSDGATVLDPVQKYSAQPVGSVTIRVQRPDGAMYSYSVPDSPWLEWEDTATGQGNERTLNYVEFALTEDMLAVAGRALCDVHFEYHQRIYTLSTASFYLDIEEKPTATSSGGIIPHNYVNVQRLTQAAFDALTAKNSDTLYIVEGNPDQLYLGDNALTDEYSLMNGNHIGMMASYNLFPIDKGKNGEPVAYETTNGIFYINGEGFFNVGEKIGRMAFEGTTSTTTEETDNYSVFFNTGYGDTADEFGDLVLGKYTLSYDIDDDTDFTDNGEIYLEVYGFNTDRFYETLLTTVHAGETKTFEVTEENPRIEIKVIAHRFSSHSWNGSSIIFTPYLRRAEYADKDVDKYQPSLQKQIVVNDAKIRSELQSYENSNNNYLMPTFSGELPVEVDGGVGGYCDEWTIYGDSDGVGERTPNLHTFDSDTKTDAGVEFVADGKTGTVTAAGVTTATSSVIAVNSTQPFPAGTYEFTCDSDATDTTYYSYVRVTGSSTTIATDRAGASVSGQFTLAEASYLTIYHRMAAQSGNYHVFKPMICKVGETPTNFIAYGYQVPLINVNEHASEEIYDPTDTDTSNGYIADKYLVANGTAQASSDYIVTEYYAFTDRKGLTVWRGSSGAATSACICFYDSSKNFLGSKGYADDEVVCIFYPPKDTVYIRASIDKSYKDNAKIFAYPSHSYTVYVGKEPLTEGKTVNQDSFEYSDNEFVLRARDASGFVLNKFDTSLDNKPKCDFTVDRLKNIENSILGG